MRKFLVLLALLISIAGYSQKKGFLSTSFGLGIPMSDFNYNANAKVGMGYGIEGGYYFTKGIGVGLKVSTITNKVDDYDFEQELKDAYIDYNYISVDATQWTSLDIAIGLYGKIPIGNKFEFEGKTLFGLLIVKSPEQRFTIMSDYVNLEYTEYPANSSVFPYNGEIVFKYLIGESSTINIFGSVTGANPTFNIYTRSNINGDITYDYGIYSQKVTLINTGIGFTYKF